MGFIQKGACPNFLHYSDLLIPCEKFLFGIKAKSVSHTTCLLGSSTIAFLSSKISQIILWLNTYAKMHAPWVLQNSTQNS